MKCSHRPHNYKPGKFTSVSKCTKLKKACGERATMRQLFISVNMQICDVLVADAPQVLFVCFCYIRFFSLLR